MIGNCTPLWDSLDCCIYYVARLDTSDLPFCRFCYWPYVDFLNYRLLQLFFGNSYRETKNCFGSENTPKKTIGAVNVDYVFLNVSQNKFFEKIFWKNKKKYTWNTNKFKHLLLSFYSTFFEFFKTVFTFYVAHSKKGRAVGNFPPYWLVWIHNALAKC